MGPTAHFSPALFEFLAELSMNNNREWFQANKARYERDVRNPLLHFVADFGKKLREISPHMVADPRPSGGSMFRIYRDASAARMPPLRAAINRRDPRCTIGQTTVTFS